MKVSPIQFAFPDRKLSGIDVPKSQFFSDLSPEGQVKKYRFFEEVPYYQHYAKAQFAVTMKKGGWDCLRHYEILASGTLPYFLDIENCPSGSLALWPKHLLTEVKALPGMPAEKVVMSAMKKGKLDQLKPGKGFDPAAYDDLRSRFLSVFKDTLTTSSLRRYVLESLGLLNQSRRKILFVFGVSGSILDYQRDLLLTALATDPTTDLVVYPHPFWHLQSCHRQIRNALYGRGFSCTATLKEDELKLSESWEFIDSEIDSFDARIACSSSNEGFSVLPAEVQATLKNRNDVIWVDGNDIAGDHLVPSCAKLVFRRELDRS